MRTFMRILRQTLGQPADDRLLREGIESSLLVRFDIVDDILGAGRVAKYDEVLPDNRVHAERECDAVLGFENRAD